MHIADLTRWLRSDGLQVVLFVIGAVLVARFVHWLAYRYVGRLDRREQLLAEATTDVVTPDDQLRHLHTLAQAAEWLAVGVVYIVALLLVITRFHLPLTSFVVPATAIGAAVGFGAQRVVQDLLAGIFLFTERQYGFGDSVMIASLGSTTGVLGTVEEVTLRTTRLRTIQGELVIIPNGAIQQVINRSRDWSRVVIDIPIALDQDVDKAMSVLRQVSAAMAQEDDWKKLLLDEPVVAGVESIQAAYLQLRISARTLPTKQVMVGRELRRRIAQAFREAGIASAAVAEVAALRRHRLPVRLSTIVLAAIFVGVALLYLFIRPAPTSDPAPRPATTTTVATTTVATTAAAKP